MFRGDKVGDRHPSEEEYTMKPGKYRHFKGNEYELLGIAKHSETMEDMVVYRALYGEGGLWVRPASMWEETVERDGKTFRRFTYIGDEEEEKNRLAEKAAVKVNRDLVLEAFEEASNNWTLHYDLQNHETIYIFTSSFMDDEEERDMLAREPDRFVRLPKKEEIYADARVKEAIEEEGDLEAVFQAMAEEWCQANGLSFA